MTTVVYILCFAPKNRQLSTLLSILSGTNQTPQLKSTTFIDVNLEKLCFCDGLAWKVGLTVEIKLQVSPV